MNGVIGYVIETTQEEANVIENVLNVLDNCPIDLDDHAYVTIFREIANGCGSSEIDDIRITYEEV